MPLVTGKELASESVNLLPSEDTEDTSLRNSFGSMEQPETLETLLESASMFTENLILTTDISPTGTATMERTKPGISTKVDQNGQDNHSKTESDSRLDQE